MTKLEAIIKPFKLEAVRDSLAKLGVEGLTATEVRGCGRQKSYSDPCKGSEHAAGFLPRIRIELVVTDLLAADAIAAIVKAAKTGKIGDGKVFVSTILDAIRIRTEEWGDRAI